MRLCSLPADGRAQTAKIHTGPRRERSDTHSPCGESRRFALDHSESDPTWPIHAEGRAGKLKITSVFAHQPRRSPQRVARAPCRGSRAQVENRKNPSFCTSTTPIPAEGRARTAGIVKKTLGFCASTTPIPAEGRAGKFKIAKEPQFLHLHHADPRRGSRARSRNRKNTRSFCTLTTPIPENVSFWQTALGPTAPP